MAKLSLSSSSLGKLSQAVSEGGQQVKRKQDRPSESADELYVERGLKYFRHSRRCLVFGEQAGDLLLSLSAKDWEQVKVVGESSSEWLQLASRPLSNVSFVNKTKLRKAIQSSDVLLGAGTSDRLEETLALESTSKPVLLFTNGNLERRLAFCQQRRCTHASVGGVTTWKGSAWIRDWIMKGWPRTVKRDIGHILIHSDKPRACQPSPRFAHLTTTELSPLDGTDLPIVFHTHATHTNWGYRKLSHKETGYSMDLPVWLVSDDKGLLVWRNRHSRGESMPLKPLQMATQLLLSSLGGSAPTKVSETMKERPANVFASVKTWLSKLRCWLPNSWAMSDYVTDKAVKADDAKIATEMWDKRVSLVLDWNHISMAGLRTLAFGHWQQKVRRGFQDFMRTTYGACWLDKVRAGRRRQHMERRDRECPSSPQRGGVKKKNTSRTAAKAEAAATSKEETMLRDAEVGCETLEKVLDSTWWEWSNGSGLLFWRWKSGEQKEAARDGMNIFVRGDLPGFFGKPRPVEQLKLKLIASKIGKVRKRGYIKPGRIQSLTDFFDVPKGNDIRMVYNGTSSGLNDALWAPSFFLPSANSAGRLLSYSSFCVDLDLGEMFLNFPMDLKLRPYAGVDLTQLAPHLEGEAVLNANGRLYERWERLFMGMRPSPYNAVRYFYWAEEFARGNPSDPKNVMRYDKVILNLPGGEDFDPTMPMVMKWNTQVNQIAPDVVTFVDDLRASGYDSESAWQVSRQVASRLQYLGIQDAPRKRRPSTQTPGAWAGCVFKIEPDKVSKSVTQEKWDKARGIVNSIADQVLADGPLPNLNHKELESQRGFLVHLTMTYSSLVPFLKGIHLTLDSWRFGRKSDGWKMTPKEWRLWVEHLSAGDPDQEDLAYLMANDGAPKTVQPVLRLPNDVRALSRLLSQLTPPSVTLRAKFVFTVRYGFGDASGRGFGSTFALAKGVSYRIGVWKRDQDDESSNWREFTNVVDSLEEEAESGRLDSAMVFFFTDNKTVESALYKGTSSSPKLLELVIRMRALETKHSVKLIVSHVSGLRMIAEGGDGVSRGILNEGVMAGESMLSFIPLNLSAIERSPSLLPWIKTWSKGKVECLAPEDWFQLGHDIRGWSYPPNDLFQRPTLQSGVFCWAPPPSAADVAIEQLRIARIKRQTSTHIFIVPRLMTPEWLKQVHKACDIVIAVPIGSPGWPTNMFEPLILGICFPFLRFDPWQIKGTPKVVDQAEQLSALHTTGLLDQRDLLRELWNEGEGLDPNGIEDDEDRLTTIWRQKPRDKNKFKRARRGDHLMVQFECDYCIFSKLKNRSPAPNHPVDKVVMACIRRANLDAFWSRAESTVITHARHIEEGMELAKSVGIEPPFVPAGPLPGFDHCGYGMAVLILLKSRKQGKYHTSHQQWETIRKFRTAYGNQIRAGAEANSSCLSLGDAEGKNYSRMCADPCASLWFHRFMQGCQRRMGVDWRPDRAITNKLLHFMLEKIELRLDQATTSSDHSGRRRWIFAGCYFVLCYVNSLRGPEGLLLELSGCLKHFYPEGTEDHVAFALRGKVKGEHHEREHLLPTVNETGSGIPVRRWLKRVLAANKMCLRNAGPAFCDEQGIVLTSRDMNECLHNVLGELLAEHPSLFLADIKTRADIDEKYDVYRSFRRGSDSQAMAMNVSQLDIDVVNRWKKKEAAGTSRPGHQMLHHYADITILLPNFRRYTKAM